MTHLDYNEFHKLSLAEKAATLEQNNIFKPFDRNIIKFISDQEINEQRKLHLLIENNFTIPTNFALQEVYNFVSMECQKILDGQVITDIENYYKQKFNNEIIEISDEAKLFLINKTRKKIRKRFKKSESILFGDDIKIDKVKILEYFKSLWFININFLQTHFKCKNTDILNFYLHNKNSSQFLGLLNVYDDLNFAIGNKRTLDFLKIKEIEIKSQLNKNKKISGNKYPKIFTSDFAFDVFFYTIKNEVKLTKRIFSIYLIPFQTQNLIFNYRGLHKEYIKMIKKEFNLTITRIESDIPSDVTDKIGEIQNNISNFKDSIR